MRTIKEITNLTDLDIVETTRLAEMVNEEAITLVSRDTTSGRVGLR
jgi:hypothetical protein